MPSTIVCLATIAGILVFRRSLALPTDSVIPSSTTTLGSPLQFTRSPLQNSTTTLGSPLQFTRSTGEPLQSTRGSPESTTTLGSPLQFTRSLPESTTTLGSPLQVTRVPKTSGEPIMATRSTLVTIATPHSSIQELNSSATLPSIRTRGSHFGWVGFFASDTCEGDPIRDHRPKIDDTGCHQVSPPAGIDNVGISWGNGALEFTGLDVFSDKNCRTWVDTILPGEEGHTKGPGACVSMKARGGVWGSVKGSVTQ